MWIRAVRRSQAAFLDELSNDLVAATVDAKLLAELNAINEPLRKGLAALARRLYGRATKDTVEWTNVCALFRHRAVDPRRGVRLDTPEVSIYQVRDGRVARSQMFHADSATVAQFLADAAAACHTSGGAR